MSTWTGWLEASALAIEIGMVGLVVGLPDVGAAYRFVRDGQSVDSGALATGEVVLWVALLATAVATIARLLRAAQRPRLVRREWGGALVVAAIGAVCLVIGATRPSVTAYSPCCGSIVQAEQLAANGR